MYRAIDEIQPTWVVGENVAGILSMVEQGEVSTVAGEATLFDSYNDFQRYELRETFTLQRICTDLEGHGYAVQPILIPSCGVGAPHRRDRVFIVARRLSTMDEGERGRTATDSESVGDNRTRREECRTDERPHGQTNREPIIGSGIRETRQPSADANGTRQPSSDKPSGRERKEMDKGSSDITLNGTERPRTFPTAADTRNTRLQETRAEQSAARHRGLGVRTSEWDEGFGRGEEIGSRWASFPTVSPVHRGNDGLSVPPYYDAIFQTRNNMDRNSVIQGALSTGKIEVDFETGKIYSSRIRGHEGKKILLQGSECNGYMVHTLSFNGIKKQCRAHQIVWIAANGLYDKDKWQIDHINRDRKDNRLCNLRLVSAAENIANSDRPDTRMLGDEERIKIWQMYNEGHMTLREIAEDYGVSKSYIHKIVSDFPSLTLSANKWRTEALKAYGNAIVPEVMYEIFRAIQITEETWNNGKQ